MLTLEIFRHYFTLECQWNPKNRQSFSGAESSYCVIGCDTDSLAPNSYSGSTYTLLCKLPCTYF